MRARPGAWLLGCVLTVAGCIASPATEPTPEFTDDIQDAGPPTAVQAIHHVRQQVSPVLTWRENPSPTVPMTLTASDGTGLDLVSMKARVVIEDPLAFTELHLVFDNPEPRRREGRFEIELPPGAALSRLAMKIRGEFQEGEVVERAKARRTYETFMHRRPDVDPALLEREAGNRVQARVFPILPHERKEIIVSFSQELGASPYRLPLQGLSTIEDFDARVVVKTHDGARDRSSLSGAISAQRVVELQRSHFTPEKDLVIELDGAGEAAGLHAGDLTVVRVRPRAERPASRPESLLVLFDTSASAGVGFEDRVERLGAVLRELALEQDFELRLLAFDQSIHTVFEGMGSELGVDTLADLVEGRALGASNLEQALMTAAGLKGHWDRALLVSDGVATAGRTERGALRIAARGLEAVGVRRMDALAPGAREDREALGDLTTALPDPGVILDDEATAASIAEGLGQAPFDDVAITVEGATWSWPKSLEGTGPGDDVLVFAHYEGPRPPLVRVMFSDPSIATQEVETLEVERPLVERAWAQARIDRIEHEKSRVATSNPSVITELDARIVELSTHYRVLTELTALLVLETEADYRRFGIDRRGKADIMTVDGGSIRLQRRTEEARETLAVAADLAAIDDAGEDEPLVVADARTRSAGEEARSSSVLGLMAQESGHFVASTHDGDDGWGGLTGTEVGEAFGVGGLGLVGQGRGGSGTGEGTIGLGEHGLIGHGGGGGGTGSGYGRGSGAGFGGRGLRIDDGAMGLGTIGTVGGPWGGLDQPQGASSGWGSPIGWSEAGRHQAVPRVHQAKAKVQGSIDEDIIRRIIRAHINEVRLCYNQGLTRNPSLAGRVEVAFTIGEAGTVITSGITSSSLTDQGVQECIAKAVRRWRFPKPPGAGVVQVAAPLVFSAEGVRMAGRPVGRVRPLGPPPKRRRAAKAPHSGRFAEAQRLLAANQTDDAYDLAWDWVETQPGDILGLLALGEALEQRGRPALAARVYGSLIDLHPSRADVRRAAGQRLERLGEPALALAIDSYDKAVKARPDHPSGARLLAWALVEQGQHERAFEVLRQALHRRYPSGRFEGVKSVLRQDLAVVAAAWLAAGSEADRQDARRRLTEHHIDPATSASTRFVVTWETDTTDVDLALRAPGSTRRHGRRIADVTTGYGPEVRVLTGSQIPSRLRATVQYYDRKAMGHAMGTLQIVAHDGNGGLRVQAQPFVLMEQGGSLVLGVFDTGVEPGLNAS
ncbi:TonB family protein [Paraliomyxa miuraensis]|uniref:TonB family protein n=1 Tax=Paraliomyxa miuraensis TaxID=376150 RepID=UPI00224E0C01|nr:TonB family protein [Paraliomyxa miuraensis]MCX4247622.1 TonB family protein [Paraliomyxa miuraensis]